MGKNLQFSNSLENIRAELNTYFYLFKLRDKNSGCLYNIKRVIIDLENTVLILENENSKENINCVISNCICSKDIINDLKNYEVILKD